MCKPMFKVAKLTGRLHVYVSIDMVDVHLRLFQSLSHAAPVHPYRQTDNNVHVNLVCGGHSLVWNHPS